MKRAVVVLPTYNEAGNIEEVIEGITHVSKDIKNWDIQILVVESTSTDNTDEIVTRLQKKHSHVHILRTEKEGLGKAYVHGFTYAISTLKAFLVFEMDADLSHNPKEIPKFLQKIEGGADFVIGSRYIKGGSIPNDWGLHRKIFSSLGNVVIRLGFMNLKITEWTNGYRAIKSWVVSASLSHIKNYPGYVFQIALLDNALKNHARIEEIPIQFKERNAGESKINFGQYIFNILSYIFFHSSFIKFIIVGGLGFLVDFTIFYLLIHKLDWVTWHANLVSTETAVICNYLINNFWSFKHKKVDHTIKAYIHSFLKFNLVSVGNILIQTIGLEVLQHFFGDTYLLEYKVGIIVLVIIPYSYFFYNKVIWKSKTS